MELVNSLLDRKNLLFLGSSVTNGAAAEGVSFVDYIAERNGCNVIKEAISGTTLVDGEESYITRLKRLDTIISVDLFVCQLSTNDAGQKKTLGRVSGTENRKGFDTETVAGAIEFIIMYVRKNWNCPIAFYTSPKFESETYDAMVQLLKEIEKKWEICVIDLWNDTEFNSITKEQRERYMVDDVHPTQKGYLEWWTPVFEKKLLSMLN